MTARDFTPTDEQAEALWESIDAADQATPYGLPAEQGRALIASPAFQSIIAAAKAEAWDEGAKWGVVESGEVSETEAEYAFLAPGDNPYRDEASA